MKIIFIYINVTIRIKYILYTYYVDNGYTTHLPYFSICIYSLILLSGIQYLIIIVIFRNEMID